MAVVRSTIQTLVQYAQPRQCVHCVGTILCGCHCSVPLPGLCIGAAVDTIHRMHVSTINNIVYIMYVSLFM